MDDSNGAPPSPPQRRKSFVEMLNPRTYGNSTSSTTSASISNAVPTAPTAPGNRKNSMSFALGLSGSSNSQDSPYNAFARQRRASISTSPTSAGSPEFRNSFDEGAIIDDDDKVGPMNSPPSPSFARRLSFGAQAMKDARQGVSPPNNNAGRRPSSSLFTLKEDSDNPNTQNVMSAARSPGTAKTGGEGFNWSDSMRNKRTSLGSANPFSGGHNRSKSFNAPAPEPPKEIPKQPARTVPGANIKKPDHLGERMLRGEFSLD